MILALGENGFQSGEGRSQTDINLSGVQEVLLKRVMAVNENVVLVLMNGRPLTIPWAAENVPSIVEAWHLGSEAGNAIADVLFGDYNPSGKLPISFPRHVGQVPIYYNHKNTGRPVAPVSNMVFWSHYTDESNLPLYPFGYGLSYTNFEYGELSVSSPTMKMNESVDVSITLTNSGKVGGSEVVQFYIRDLVASVSRPVKELKGFEKIFLEAGESRQVTFSVDKETLKFYAKNSWVTEPGEFTLFVGGNSVDVLETTLVVE